MCRKGACGGGDGLFAGEPREDREADRGDEDEHRQELMAERRMERHGEEKGEDAEPHLGECKESDEPCERSKARPP